MGQEVEHRRFGLLDEMTGRLPRTFEADRREPRTGRFCLQTAERDGIEDSGGKFGSLFGVAQILVSVCSNSYRISGDAAQPDPKGLVIAGDVVARENSFRFRLGKCLHLDDGKLAAAAAQVDGQLRMSLAIGEHDFR